MDEWAKATEHPNNKQDKRYEKKQTEDEEVAQQVDRLSPCRALRMDGMYVCTYIYGGYVCRHGVRVRAPFGWKPKIENSSKTKEDVKKKNNNNK